MRQDGVFVPRRGLVCRMLEGKTMISVNTTFTWNILMDRHFFVEVYEKIVCFFMQEMAEPDKFKRLSPTSD